MGAQKSHIFLKKKAAYYYAWEEPIKKNGPGKNYKFTHEIDNIHFGNDKNRSTCYFALQEYVDTVSMTIKPYQVFRNAQSAHI